MADAKPDHKPDDDAAAQDIARALGMTGAAAAGENAESAPDPTRTEGKLRLDKDGALADRPKLQPVKVHKQEGDAPGEASGDPQSDAKRTGEGPRRASLPPKRASLRPPGMEDAAPASTVAPKADLDAEVRIPAGTFLFGETRQEQKLPAFRIDKYAVTNAAYEAFVRATGHRPPMYWPSGQLQDELRDHPVVGVDYFDALAYARWKGKDLPFEDEWERAARGTDGRTYPWGEENDLHAANTARASLKMTVPVTTHRTNVSPDGVHDMVGNCWEITHSPAQGGGVVVRGGSWYDFALYAKTYFRFATRSDARNGTIGFRCCVREEAREDEVREVGPEMVDGEIAARTGSQPPVDVSEFGAERRDLVPDLRRLHALAAEVEAEALLGPIRAPGADARAEEIGADSPLTPRSVRAGKEETASERVHVKAEPVEKETGKVRAAKPAPAVATVAAADARSQDEPARPAPAQPEAVASRGTPTSLWVLLGFGFLLLGGLIAMMANRSDPVEIPDTPYESGDRPPSVLVDSVALLPGVPASWDREGFDPMLHDGTVRESLALIREGVCLLVFADPSSKEGRRTIRSTENLARRLSTTDVRVVLVVPRRMYLNKVGALQRQIEIRGSLSKIWTLHGIDVLLDPADAGGRGTLLMRYIGEEVPSGAVLLSDGSKEARASPPEGSGFHVGNFGPIGKQAVELAAD